MPNANPTAADPLALWAQLALLLLLLCVAGAAR